MSQSDQETPPLSRYYLAGLLASALGYLGILTLIVISLAAERGDAQMALAAFFFGGFFGAIPAAAIAFVITAPLGCLFGVALREWFAPGHWHGAVNGVATVVTVLLGMALLDGAFSQMPDAGTIVFVVGLLAVGAGSGWIAQRKVLDWPNDHSQEDFTVFD